MRLIEALVILLLVLPSWAHAQGAGGGVRGLDTHEQRAAMIDQFIRAGRLAGEARRYALSFDLEQVPAELSQEREIFGDLLAQGLVRDVVEATHLEIAKAPGGCPLAGKCASTISCGRGAAICFDPDRCAYEFPPSEYNEDSVKRALVGAVFHEKTHQFREKGRESCYEEPKASRVSAYVTGTAGDMGSGERSTPAAATVALGLAGGATLVEGVARSLERERWQKAPERAREILTVCGRDLPCLRSHALDRLPDGLSSLVLHACLWPYRKYVSPPASCLLPEVIRFGDCARKFDVSDGHPLAAPACMRGALLAIGSVRTIPGDVNSFEKYQIRAARDGCQAIPEGTLAHSWEVNGAEDPLITSPFAHLQGGLGLELRRGQAREACYVRAAAALSGLSRPSHLAWRQHPMRVLDASCSQGRSRRLSGSKVEDMSWLKFGVGGCYQRGFEHLLAHDDVLEPSQQNYELGLVRASCRFADSRNARLAAFIRAECLDHGRMHLLGELNLRLLAHGCQEPKARADGESIARCYESGMSYLERYARPHESQSEFRYTLGMMLSAFTAVAEPEVREAMARRALESVLREPEGSLTALARACRSGSHCLELISGTYAATSPGR